jgi:hypothetical protein
LREGLGVCDLGKIKQSDWVVWCTSYLHVLIQFLLCFSAL